MSRVLWEGFSLPPSGGCLSMGGAAMVFLWAGPESCPRHSSSGEAFMGFLDELAGKATGGVPGGSGDSGSGLAAGIMDMLNKQPGGLPGLLQTFHDKGLGGVASSWVSTG